ncbi:MAG: hypothetical protein O3A87_06645 [Verrucomicrobia bacterium]|nr:hypothetical protein [Verrucomicrobiota bacterium]
MVGGVFFHTESPSLMTVIVIVVAPCLLFVPLCLFTPNSRRVRCQHCDFDHDYPCRPTTGQ